MDWFDLLEVQGTLKTLLPQFGVPSEIDPETRIQVQVVYLGDNPRKYNLESAQVSQ